MNFDDIKDKSKGRWVGILRSLGIEIDETGKHGPCVFCGGKDRARFDDKAGKGTYICGQCGSYDGFSLVMKALNCDFKTAMESVAQVVGGCEVNTIPKEKKITPEILRKVFKESEPANENNVAGKYLQKRGLSVIPKMLRSTRKCWEPETKKNQCAMLAVFSLPDDTAITMHRTFLASNGDKLGIQEQKKIMPSLDKMVGGAVRLFEQEKTIGIAEGIETAIAAHEDLGIPCWAALTAPLLESFAPPSGIEHVVIIGDNDANFAGQKAAYILANRLSVQLKLEVSVHIPEIPGEDWLDVLNKQKR